MSKRTIRIAGAVTLLGLLVAGQAHAQGSPPSPPGGTPTVTPIVATPATGPDYPPRTGSPTYTVFSHNDQAGWREPVDRKAAPRGFHGWHVCGSPWASSYPWCVPVTWKRGEKSVGRFRFEWLYWPGPRGYWTYMVVSAMTPAETPGAQFADQTYVYYGGAGTSWPGCPMNLARGTRVRIPELAGTGVQDFTVHDIGYGWCYAPQAGVTGRIELWMPVWLYDIELGSFWGRGFIHRVFVYT